MIVITGASGQLASLVIDALAPRVDPSTVRLGSRSPERLAGRTAAGFATARLDFDDPASMDAAFEGARTVLMISADGPDALRLVQHGAAIEAARRAGVGRLVYTSFQSPDPDSPCPLNRLHAATEALIRDSGLAHVFLRNGQYADNLALSVPQAVAHGAVTQPGIDGRVAYVTRADAAAATAALLAGAGAPDRTHYTLTGPEALSAVDIAEELTRLAGRPIGAVEMAPDAFGRMLAENGLPPFMVEAMLGLFAAGAAGAFEAVTDDVRDLTGRAPVSARPLLAGFAGVAT